MVGDTGFEPMTSTVGKQKDKKNGKNKGFSQKTVQNQAFEISKLFDIFVDFSIFLTNFGHSLVTVYSNMS